MAAAEVGGAEGAGVLAEEASYVATACTILHFSALEAVLWWLSGLGSGARRCSGGGAGRSSGRAGRACGLAALAIWGPHSQLSARMSTHWSKKGSDIGLPAFLTTATGRMATGFVTCKGGALRVPALAVMSASQPIPAMHLESRSRHFLAAAKSRIKRREKVTASHLSQGRLQTRSTSISEHCDACLCVR